MTAVIIEKLTKDTWKDYKYLRIRSLTEDTQAFGDSIEEAEKRSEDEWIERVDNPFTTILVAKVDSKLAGIIGIHFLEHKKQQHIAFLWGVFVSKEFRGLGIGNLLLQKAEEEINKRPGITKIELDVVTTQKSAKKMYEAFNYKTVGILHKHLKVGGNYLDMDILEKIL